MQYAIVWFLRSHTIRQTVTYRENVSNYSFNTLFGDLVAGKLISPEYDRRSNYEIHFSFKTFIEMFGIVEQICNI